MAAAQPTAAPEYLFNTLLSSSASCLGTSAKVVINLKAAIPNRASSGQPTLPTVVRPKNTTAGNSPTIEDMEAAAKELHDLQLADYEQDKIQLLNRQSASGGC